MPTEPIILILAGLLQLSLIFLHGTYIALNFGVVWGTGRRNQPREDSDLGRRISRSLANTTENMAVFVPVFGGAALAGPVTPLIVSAALVWLAARTVFAGLYIGNVPYLRTLVWYTGQIAVLVIAVAALAAL